MKPYMVLMLGVLPMFLFVACSKSPNASKNANNVNVIFMNAMTSGDSTLSLDGHVTDSPLIGAKNIALCKYTNYTIVSAATYDNMAFWLSGKSMIDSTYDLAYNDFYTLYACGTVKNPQMVLTQDYFIQPAAGFTAVRFINLCMPNPHLKCYVGGTMIDSNLGYAPVYKYELNNDYVYSNGFMEVPAGRQTIYVVGNDYPVFTATTTNYEFDEQKHYTIIFTDTATSILSTGHKFRFTVINNH